MAEHECRMCVDGVCSLVTNWSQLVKLRPVSYKSTMYGDTS